MPSPGRTWYHITINTYGSWLHGDPRGFRSKHHRIHSSGDYRNPPPPGEHEGLHKYAKSMTGHEVSISPVCRETIGNALLKSLNDNGHRVLAIAVGSHHAHILVELPPKPVKVIIGEAKRYASTQVLATMPGRVWAAGCHPVHVKNRGHQQRVFEYIVRHQGEDAWVWTFRDDVVFDPGK